MLTHHPRRRTGSFRQRAVPYTFVGPAFALLAIFGLLPIVVALFVSFTDMDITGLAHPRSVEFIGFDNYVTLFKDSSFWNSVRNTAIYVAIGTPSIVFISLTIAVLLDLSQSRFFRILRAFYFVPSITAILAISLIWGYLYNTQFGLLNYMLSQVGIGPIEWLSDPKFAKLSLAAVGIWRATGLNIIIFLAALQAIPRELYEASALDGATTFQQTRYVTVPSLRFSIFFVTVTTLINWMQFFDEPFVLTRGNDTTETTTSVSIYIYNEGFRFNEFGFASAASVVLFVIIFTVTSLQLRRRVSNADA